MGVGGSKVHVQSQPIRSIPCYEFENYRIRLYSLTFFLNIMHKILIQFINLNFYIANLTILDKTKVKDKLHIYRV